jgi:predicted amidohydrolase YtcJ
MLILNAELRGKRTNLRVQDGGIAEISPALAPADSETIIDAKGGAVIPGLHDHHIHLNAAAASLSSVHCGPPAVQNAADLIAALHAAPGNLWLRGINYHASVAGEITREWLDQHAPQRPIRIQHRSGRLWIFNSAALDILGPDAPVDGRLQDNDAWLAARLARTPPDLAALGAVLASHGITGVTDTTPRNTRTDLQRYATAGLRQYVLVMGTESLTGAAAPPGSKIGALKLHHHEDDLPPLETLIAQIAAAHSQDRPIAAHCVTRAELFLTLAAIDAAGPHPGDRIEHAAIAPPEAIDWIARLNLTVVTQPHFVTERAEAYLTDVPPEDRQYLYRLRGFLEAGIRLAAGSDAPLGGLNPWAAMHAATQRPPCLAPAESLSRAQALALYTGPLESPGGPARMIHPGGPADLAILDRGWCEAARDLSAVRIRATLRCGEITHASNAP